MTPLQFDIPAVIRQKAPQAHVPAFIIRYLERITHVKQMNSFLRKYPSLHGYEFIKRAISEELGCSASIDGTEHIPTDGKPVIFVSNHPLGGLDGMIIAQMIHETRQSSNRQAIEQQKMWESGTDVLTFPAGSCSRLQRIDGHWQIKDLEWQKNFVQRAREYQRDIVPIYFEGRNSNFFYALAYLRKLLHIKVNIERLYLVDEMYGAYGKHFKVHVMPPIPYTMFDNSRTPKQWAQYVKELIYSYPNK